MTVVLFSAGRRAQPPRTVRAIAHMSATVAPEGGERFVLVSWHPPSEELASVVAEVVVLAPGTPVQSATGWAPLPVRILGRLRDPGLVWRAARRDRRVAEVVEGAAMLVALDTPATLVTWRLARRSTESEAVQGFPAARSLLMQGRDVSGGQPQVR